MIFLRKSCVHVRLLPLATNSDSWRTCSSTPSRTGSRHRRSSCARAIVRAAGSRNARWPIYRSYRTALIDGIRAPRWRQGTPETRAEPGFKIVRSLAHGHVAAVRGMIRKLGLDRMLQGRTRREARVPSDRSHDHSTDHCAGIEARLPPSVGAGDGNIQPGTVGRPHRCRRARSVRRARLAHRAATADRGGAGQEAPRRRHAGTLRRLLELHGGTLLPARQVRPQPRPSP